MKGSTVNIFIFSYMELVSSIHTKKDRLSEAEFILHLTETLAWERTIQKASFLY